MFYICTICMMKPKITDKSSNSSASKNNYLGPSQLRLNLVNPAHRKILEGIVAPLIDMTPLKDTLLLLCKDCNLLIETMEKFQNTALKGVQYLLQLHMSQQHEAVMPVPIPIKEEPEDSFEFDRMGSQKLRESRLQMISPVPVKREPEDAVFEDLDEQELSEPDMAARARLLGLTEELHLKPEPASRPPSELGRDSESTVTCDEDCEDYRAVNWEVSRVSAAEALAELRGARACAAFAAARHRCERCALTFVNRGAKETHDAKHYKTAGPHLCRICSQRLPSSLLLRGHEAAHLTRYSCRACMLRSADMDAVKLHRCRVTADQQIVRTMGGANRQTGARSRLDAREWYGDCEDCRAHSDWTHFVIHYQNVHYDPNKSACYVCQRSYVQFARLAHHVKQHYMQSEKPQPKRRRRVKRRTKKSSSGAKRKM